MLRHMADHERSRSDLSRDSKKEGGLLGIGLDARDGHHRVSSGEEFLIVGGSAETHEQMQDLVIRMEEKLKARGKTISDLDNTEFEDLVVESFE